MLRTIAVFAFITVLGGCTFYSHGNGFNSQWNAHRLQQNLQDQQQFNDFMNRTTGPRTSIWMSL